MTVTIPAEVIIDTLLSEDFRVASHVSDDLREQYPGVDFGPPTLKSCHQHASGKEETKSLIQAFRELKHIGFNQPQLNGLCNLYIETLMQVGKNFESIVTQWKQSNSEAILNQSNKVAILNHQMTIDIGKHLGFALSAASTEEECEVQLLDLHTYLKAEIKKRLTTTLTQIPLFCIAEGPVPDDINLNL